MSMSQVNISIDRPVRPPVALPFLSMCLPVGEQCALLKARTICTRSPADGALVVADRIFDPVCRIRICNVAFFFVERSDYFSFPTLSDSRIIKQAFLPLASFDA